ncbi:MAG: hypothetical protein KatS3mg076_1260 [Candidatus Binatia bacterium]|nr:MAG: hypothetical protein KatS3mg076_1260 [Candidatus Binatia bacterium]
MRAEVERVREEALADLARCSDLRAVEDVRVRYLGRKGRLTELVRRLGQLPPEARPELGALLNAAKRTLEERIEAARDEFRRAELSRRLERSASTSPCRGRGRHSATFIP